ncbi:MAG: protein kinase, partial [Calditrichae bacterium]|nr:protein kinase [Calditrichia bacterium]
MSYYEGETVKEKIERCTISITETLDITIQVVEGLAVAHKQGIIHRDIKPGNIMVTGENVVKLLDFGLAKRAGVDITKSQTYLGTLAYMSPEQLRGEKVDHRTDIWSLGVVIYQMLTGELPFKAEHPQAVLYLILNEESPSPSPLLADIPDVLVEIVQKALHKDPRHRYQKIEEMGEELKAWQKPSGIPPPGKTSPAKASIPRKRIITYVSILLILILAGIFIRSQFLSDLITSSRSHHQNRIAVLPFDNISGGEENEYFAEGMTEELISSLSQISDFEVIARTSVMRYKNTAKSVKEIGTELQIGSALTGSIRKANNQLRITVRLVDVNNETNLWSRNYDR